MPRITVEDIEAHRPDVLLPPDPEFAEEYREAVAFGRERAAEASIAFVFLARNSMPWLPRTLALLEETGAMFREWSAFAMENDSADETKDVLAAWADGQQRQASLNTFKRPHLSHTVSEERMVALAEYRAECQRWVRDGEPVDWVCVLDSDSWGGWSVDGVATSIAHMERDRSWYGLASYSWCEMMVGEHRFAAHYDALALRWNHWRRRDQQWVHHWHPAVGSPPIEFNSAFGQLAVYRPERFLKGTYSGFDCEHVALHRSIATAIEDEDGDYYDGPSYTRFGLNPSSRCTSFWVPNGGQHSDD